MDKTHPDKFWTDEVSDKDRISYLLTQIVGIDTDMVKVFKELEKINKRLKEIESSYGD